MSPSNRDDYIEEAGLSGPEGWTSEQLTEHAGTLPGLRTT